MGRNKQEKNRGSTSRKGVQKLSDCSDHIKIVLYDGNMNKKKVAWALASVLFLTVVIPIAINESYKYGVIYVTKWEAADVLSYYGALLGSISTIVALVVTIAFTKKQIQRDRFLELNRAKWEKVDLTVIQILMDISPLKMCNFEVLSGPVTENIQIIISNLLHYEATAKTSMNIIKCYANATDYRKMEGFLDELYDSIMQFCKIGDELLDEYLALQTSALENGGIIPNTELLQHLDRATEINKRIPQAHDVKYQKLLNMKRDVFERIYAEIEAEANQKLQFKK